MMQNRGRFVAKKGENVIECLHIKFMLVEDVFESRTTKNKEKMLNTC
jgi:hypothetical protein